MGENGKIDKRRFPRAGAKFLMEYKVCRPIEAVKMAGTDNKNALMMDLGEGGAAFVAEYNLPVGSVLEIKFMIITRDYSGKAQHKKIVIMSEVKNSTSLGRNEYRIGIEFMQMDDEKRKVLDAFVRSKQ
ncbi:MAG: PilZ domain-containing protein [Candidatus Omnitrophota bacterium]|nr:PilZ domain-containing protein [Candidatus Omnitrophota bacterium]